MAVYRQHYYIADDRDSWLLFLSDVLEITRAWWLTAPEIEFAKKRMQLEGRANCSPHTRAKLRRIFSSWHIYPLPLNGGGAASQPAFQLWMKARGASVTDINVHPTFTSVVQDVSMLA